MLMNTQEIIDTIVSSGSSITRQDINDVLVSVGQPGQLQEEKRIAIMKLLQNNHETSNGSILDTLDSFGAF